MFKKFSLVLCLINGIILSGSAVEAQIAEPATPSTYDGDNLSPVTEPETKTEEAKAVLTPADLPPGFQSLPPEFSEQIASQFQLLSQQLGQGNLQPEDYFVLVNPNLANLQIVMGFTGEISEEALDNFDANLENMQKPENREQTLALMQNTLKDFPGLEIVDYEELPLEKQIADSSTAMTTTIKLQGRSFKVDMVAFRRNDQGVLTGVMYFNNQEPQVSVAEVANKLDERILELSLATDSIIINN